MSVHRTPRIAAGRLAEQVTGLVARAPATVLGLPTGRTPVPFYERLVACLLRHRVDVSRLRTFNLDEFRRLPADDPGSYRSFMERHFFAHVAIPREHIGFLDGMAPDAEAECDRYERAIAAAGGIDLQILGIGTNGHIGFNEPAAALEPRTHRAVLRSETRRANAVFFGNDPARVPREALSMGMATILRAKSIVLLATGKTKARAVAAAVAGPLTTRHPASFLQLHPDVEVMLDEAAAGLLGGRVGALKC